MADREKVIKGLEHCEFGGSGACYENDCPYYQSNDCTDELKNDIIVLLKEQEPKRAHWIEGEAALSYDGVYGDDYIVCSGCHKAFCIMDNCTEEFNYCPHCGAKMNGGEAGC